MYYLLTSQLNIIHMDRGVRFGLVVANQKKITDDKHSGAYLCC
jgi:hypothetical protein